MAAEKQSAAEDRWILPTSTLQALLYRLCPSLYRHYSTDSALLLYRHYSTGSALLPYTHYSTSSALLLYRHYSTESALLLYTHYSTSSAFLLRPIVYRLYPIGSIRWSLSRGRSSVTSTST